MSARWWSTIWRRSASARKLHPLERAAFASAYANKKYTKGILRGASGAFGNAATRLASFVVKGGSNVYGSYPDIDELYPQQASELDPKKREAILRQDAADWCTKRRSTRRSGSWPSSAASGRGSASPAFGKIAGFPYTAPFEDLTIKGA